MVHLLRRVAHHYFTHGGHSVFRAHRRHAPQTQTCIVLNPCSTTPKGMSSRSLAFSPARRGIARAAFTVREHQSCVIPTKPERLATAHGGTCWFSWPAF